MATTPSTNPAFWASLDPNNSGDLVDLQRNQMIAQMMLQQGLSGAPPTQMAGNVAIRQSPVEGLSRMFQAYLGNKMMGDYSQKLGAMNAKSYAAMTGTPTMADANQGPQPQPDAVGQSLAQGAAQGSAGPTNDNAARLAAALQQAQQGQPPQSMPGQPMPQGRPAPLAPGGAFNPAGFPTRFAANYFAMDPSAAMGKQADALAPTPEMKLAAAVYGQNSPQYQESLQKQVTKAGYIAPVNARPGSILRDPISNRPIAFNPHVPDNGTPVFDAAGNVVAVRPLAGANELIQGQELAKGLGKAGAKPTVAYDQNGQPVFSTELQDVGRAAGAQPAPGRIGSPEARAQGYTPESLRILQDERAKPTNSPADNAGLDREIAKVQGAMPASSRLTPVLPPGVNTAANDAQTQLSKKFTELQQQNAQAQNTTSYLENIKQLSKTASTGRFTDRQQLINSLLSQAGVSEKASDAVTANNLLDKYGNQIVARLGQGGLGTDAARSILQSAYPNAHMTPQAISEAADNLIGANEMVKAKASLLSPHGNARDPVAYQQKEMAFDQAADPRIWQLKRMTPEQAQSYLSSMDPQTRAGLQQRAMTLKHLGVF